MAKTLDVIGSAKCLCCDEDTPVKQQSNGYAMIMCPWCGAKVQAFNAKSDALIRRRLKVHLVAATPPVNTLTPGPKPKTGFNLFG